MSTPAPTDETMATVIDQCYRLARTVIGAVRRDPNPGTHEAAGAVATSGREGLGGKYLIWRTDQRDRPGEKHHGCRYFVLDLTHDPAAAAAIAAYVAAVARSNPQLAADLVAEHLN